MENPDNQENIRNPDGTFKPGQSGNPAGRPKGQSLKEFWKRRLAEMSEEEKERWTKANRIDPNLVWKMAEGMPPQQTDITSGGKPIFLPSEVLEKNKLNETSSSPESDSQGQPQV